MVRELGGTEEEEKKKNYIIQHINVLLGLAN